MIPALIIAVGGLIAAYPYISNEIYKNRASSVITSSEKSISSTSQKKLDEIRRQADKYNSELVNRVGVLHDPFDTDVIKKAPKGYESQLSVNGSPVMGEIVIPRNVTDGVRGRVWPLRGHLTSRGRKKHQQCHNGTHGA